MPVGVTGAVPVTEASAGPNTSRHYYVFDANGGSQWLPSLETLLEYARAMEKASQPCWVDVEGETAEARRRVLVAAAMPLDVPEGVVSAVVSPAESDTVELQPTAAQYVSGVVSCSAGSGPVLPSAAGRRDAADGNTTVDAATVLSPAEALDAANGVAWYSFLCTERVMVSFHGRPVLGLREVVRSVEMRFGGAGGVPEAGRFSPSAVLATLVAFTSESMLPDPTALLSEVDCIDEMVLLIAPGERDQPDLLRRVALLRRRISAFRSRLYLKEKLLQELVTPVMRGSFVARDAQQTVAVYRETMDKITQVADRLDDARDILNQANLNFVTGVSMRMSQSSANMDFKMQILGQVATICLPLNLVASILGMNCTVPWQSDTHPSLNAFWGIVAVMVAWCVLWSIPTIRDMMRGNQPRAIVPTDA